MMTWPYSFVEMAHLYTVTDYKFPERYFPASTVCLFEKFEKSGLITIKTVLDKEPVGIGSFLEISITEKGRALIDLEKL